MKAEHFGDNSEVDKSTLTYENLKKNPAEFAGIKGFFRITNEDNKQGYSHGWKLHISVKWEQVEEAFNLIAPSLRATFPVFKVIDTGLKCRKIFILLIRCS